MPVLAVFLLVFNTCCYTVQNFFNKQFSMTYQGPSSAATPVFTVLYGFITGLATFAYNGFAFVPSSITWVLGLCNGLVLFVFNLSMIKAARTGPYSFQTIMNLFGNILLPLLFAALYWQEQPSALKLAGIGLMLVSFVLFNLKGLNMEGRKKGYFFWVGLLFTSNGLFGILVDAQQRVMMQTQRNEMIMITFFTSALFSLLYLLAAQRGKAPKAFRMGKKPWLYAVGSSVAAAIAINLLMVMLSMVPVSILYTMENGGVLMLSVLLSVTVLHEKLEKHMIAGFAVAVVSLVLLGL